MKNKIKFLFFFAGLSFFYISCNKDLTLQPIYFQPTTFTTEGQLVNQLAGTYDIFEMDQLYAQGLWGYLEAGADESFRNGTSASTVYTELYDITSSEANIGTFWRQCYNGIERANVIIQDAPTITMDTTKRANIIGQARFIRAYCYFLLVSNFGDVPIKLQTSLSMGTNFNLPRSATKDIYSYIISEMTAAEAMIPPITQPQSWQSSAATTTVVSKDAVDAILCRVCLYAAGYPLQDPSKYQLALTWANKVISSGLHSLNSAPLAAYSTTPAYARLFINNMQNNVNDNNITEGIWDAAFISKSNTSGTYSSTGYPVTQQLGAIMGIYCPDATATSIIGYGAGTYRVHNKLYNLFASGDQRRDWAIAPYMYKTNASTTKYFYLTVNITGGGGTGAAATAYTNASGAITSVTVDNPGSGYTSAPAISFTGYTTGTSTTASGTGATAVATISGGKITGINITASGSGYPTIYERCVGKWRREYETNLPPVRQQNYTSCNFPIIRYADVLLIAAEADLQVNGAPSAAGVEYFNQVRRRAFGYPPSTPKPGFDVTTFTLQNLMDERSRELCFEGVRRQDLIRWGIMTTAMQNVLTDVTNNAPASYNFAASFPATNFISNPTKYVLFPIPGSGEIAHNSAITQNPGW